MKRVVEEKSLVRGRTPRRMEKLAILRMQNTNELELVLHKAYVMAFLKTALANSAYSIAIAISLPSVSDTFSQ